MIYIYIYYLYIYIIYINMLSTGEITFIKGGILANIRLDGRRNHEIRNPTLTPHHLLYTSGSCKFEGECVLYTGIKLELAQRTTIKVNISSIKNKKCQHLEELLEELFVSDFTSLKVGKKAWALKVEVFLLTDINEAYMESIGQSISEALHDLRIPKIQVTKNCLTDEEEYELLQGEFERIQFKIPTIHVIGQIEREFVKDMSFKEFHSVDKKYIVSLGGLSAIRTFDRFTDGYQGEDFLRVLQFVKS